MSGFVEITASNMSLSKRKLVAGVGINDADYTISPVINGKRFLCAIYSTWSNMIKRCYSPKLLKARPSYIGCSVSREWLTFSIFKSWMVEQSWEGKELDKDILIQGNKIYSPETCIFVTPAINLLLTDRAAKRGEWPIGVYFNKRGGKYVAQCVVEGKAKYLGVYSEPREAHEAYKKFKYAHIADVANHQAEPLRSALISYVINQ